MNLNLERIKRGMSQKQLAQISNVSEATIVKLEKGDIDSVTVRILKKVSETLGMSMLELFFSDDEQ